MQAPAVPNRRSEQAGKRTARIGDGFSRMTASGISYFGHNIRPRSSSILRVGVATGQSCTRMRQTCTYLVTGNFAILSIIPSSYHKKNTRFRVFRECNMDFSLCTVAVEIKAVFLFLFCVDKRNKRILNQSILIDLYVYVIAYTRVSMIYRTSVNAIC